MKKEFVPYEIALELKELGFDEECLDYYIPNSKAISEILDSDFKIGRYNSDTNNIYGKRGLVSRPTFSQAFRFFREKYMLSGEIYIFKNIWNFDIEDISNSIQLYTSDIMCYNSYEEAELECLVKLIDIVKKQNVK